MSAAVLLVVLLCGSAEAATRHGRLKPSNRTLLLDGEPWLSRGVAYSPTPIGIEPSGSQSLDFFTDEYAAIFRRDLPRMAAAGINSLRIYVMDADCEGVPTCSAHKLFFEECEAHNISVIGGFELSASHHNLRNPVLFGRVKQELREQLDSLKVGGAMPHPVVMWTVGNELNLPANGFVCDGNGTSACMYNGSEVLALYRHIDELCEIVVRAPSHAPSPTARAHV